MAHLIIVGIIALLVLVVFSVILRNSGQRYWWVTILAILAAPVLWPFIRMAFS